MLIRGILLLRAACTANVDGIAGVVMRWLMAQITRNPMPSSIERNQKRVNILGKRRFIWIEANVRHSWTYFFKKFPSSVCPCSVRKLSG